MTAYLPPDLSPTSCLDADSAAAQELTWLPYAVRFKLDECGLRLSLREWQQLTMGEREALVHAPLLPGTGGFRLLALALGAKLDAVRLRTPANGLLDGIDLGRLQIADADYWLTSATPFARYVIEKLAKAALARSRSPAD